MMFVSMLPEAINCESGDHPMHMVRAVWKRKSCFCCRWKGRENRRESGGGKGGRAGGRAGDGRVGEWEVEREGGQEGEWEVGKEGGQEGGQEGE